MGRLGGGGRLISCVNQISYTGECSKRKIFMKTTRSHSNDSHLRYDTNGDIETVDRVPFPSYVQSTHIPVFLSIYLRVREYLIVKS